MSRVVAAFAVAAVSAVAAAVLAPVPARAAVPPTFTFRGSGFGHGVGMSQYGALGQAKEGRTAAQILTHYYVGARVEAVTDEVGIRVNLLSNVTSASARGESLGEGGGFIRAVAGATVIDAPPGEVVTFGVAGNDVSVRKGSEAPATAPTVRLQWSGGPTLLNLIGGAETFAGNGHRYRYGEIDVAVVGGSLQVVVEMALHQQYVRGIAEVPSSWPTAALEAQAIAARTYALRKVRLGQRAACRCHVYDTVSDQVYAGWSKETEATYGVRWVAAVDATQPSPTTGIVVTDGKDPISANYYSSSGGRTETNMDGFGSSTLFSYLQPVDDRWSLSPSNPFASWSYTRSQAAVASAFGLPDVASVDLRRRTAGGSLKTATATSSTGQKATITGTQLRQRLELPARWIGPSAVRVAGADRYTTSVAIGDEATSGRDESSVVVLASGEAAHLVDGLVAAPLARAKSAPLLLTARTSLPAAVGDDIAKRKATTALLVGGEGAIGTAVESALRQRGVTTIKRLAGATRFDTGLAVAREMGGPRQSAVVASGENGRLADALAGGGAAAGTGQPVLLVQRDAVPTATRQALTELAVTSTFVLGGPAAVSDATLTQLPRPKRLAGANRYATAAAVADEFADDLGASSVALASGADAGLVDSLPGGALGQVTLLTAPAGLTGETGAWLRAHSDVARLLVLGGTAAVSAATFEQATEAIRPSGRLPSRIPGFDEVWFAVQPPTGAARQHCGVLADTPALREQGMTGRRDFAGYDGMVFRFDADTTAKFHMRNVPIALAIAWFHADGRWLGAAEMAPCGDRADCPLYGAPAPFRHALEAPGGGLGELGATAGSLMVAGGSCNAS